MLRVFCSLTILTFVFGPTPTTPACRAEESWQPAKGPLMTEWGKQVAGLYTDLWRQKDTQGMTGQFFCQLYDTESECDGLVSYDRAVWKVDPEVIRAAASGKPTAAAREAAKVPFTYQNPVSFSYPYFDGTKERTVAELRDPAIIREGDTYYLTFTVFPFTHSTSRDASKIDHNSPPGIMLYSSPDLKSWKFEKWLVKSSELPEDCPYKHRFWAPEIYKINGKFYLVFTADNWIKDEYNKGGKIGNYVAFVGVSDKVAGPYEHITWLKGAGCDTTLFGDDDGKTYATMPFGNEYIQEVDLSGIERGDIKLLGQRKMIVSKDTDVAGQRLHFLQRHHFHVAVARQAGQRLQVQLLVSRQHRQEHPAAISAGHQRLEYLVKRQGDVPGDALGGQVVGIDPVLAKLVRDAEAVEDAAGEKGTGTVAATLIRRAAVSQATEPVSLWRVTSARSARRTGTIVRSTPWSASARADWSSPPGSQSRAAG